jgi:hypothetical protein
LGGAEPPPAETLPEGLRPLCELEAHRFIGKDADWQARFERLRERLAVIPGLPAPRFRLPSARPSPSGSLSTSPSGNVTRTPTLAAAAVSPRLGYASARPIVTLNRTSLGGGNVTYC